jgi:TetR/AcrR family transcriptional regulator
MMARAAEAEGNLETRELILRAALRAFAERGFDGATAREIASDAGVNHGLIRYYFGDKLKLWKGAVDLAFAELGARLDGILHDETVGDDRRRMGLLIRGFVHYVGRNPEFVRLMHDEGKRPGPRMRWLVDRHVKPIYETVTAVSERFRGNRLQRIEIPPIHLHYILAGSVSLIFHQAAECKRLSGQDPFDEEFIEEHARIVEALLLGTDHEENPE